MCCCCLVSICCVSCCCCDDADLSRVAVAVSRAARDVDIVVRVAVQFVVRLVGVACVDVVSGIALVSRDVAVKVNVHAVVVHVGCVVVVSDVAAVYVAVGICDVDVLSNVAVVFGVASVFGLAVVS